MSLLDRIVVVTLPMVPKFIVGKVASNYIAGETLDDAVRTVRELNHKGFMATMDVLGEFISERAEAEANVQAYGVLLDRIAKEKLDANVSVKLTALGMDIDLQFNREMLNRVIVAAAAHRNFVRIDMEDSPHTSDTLKIYDELRGKANVGTVIQAYMRRSSDDIRKLMEAGKTNFRLCKGIYREPEAIAYKGREEIRDNFMLLLEQMFNGGAYVGIATHDEVLVEKSEALIKKYKLTPDRYEFQMLLGVRHALRDEIRSRGHRLRVYVPFGEAWYGYSTRRLKENPQIAGYVFKAMLGITR